MEEKKLLIVHHGALGDLVVFFPVVIRLRKIFRRIDLLCQHQLGKIAQALNIVDKYFPLESASFAALFSDFVDHAVKNILCSYHEVTLFSNSSLLQDNLSKITGKHVHRIPPQPEINKSIHITEYILSQIVKCGLLKSVDTVSESILHPAEHPDRRDPQHDPLKIVLHPGSGSPKKCWPISNFVKIASSLNSEGMQTEFVLGPAEHFMAESLEKDDEHKSNIHVMDSLAQLASILKTAGGFVGNDSGVSHLSGFLGLPTVVVFGPTDPERWRPIGRSVDIVRLDLNCMPCFETDKNRCEKRDCFNLTTPGMVLDALMQNISSDHVDK